MISDVNGAVATVNADKFWRSNANVTPGSVNVTDSNVNVTFGNVNFTHVLQVKRRYPAQGEVVN